MCLLGTHSKLNKETNANKFFSILTKIKVLARVLKQRIISAVKAIFSMFCVGKSNRVVNIKKIQAKTITNFISLLKVKFADKNQPKNKLIA